MAPTEAELEEKLRGYLATVELDGLTQRIVREELEKIFGVDLTAQKALIKDLTVRILSERQQEEEEEGEEEEEAAEEEDHHVSDISGSDDSEDEKPAKRKGGGGFAKEVTWSEEMAAFLGAATYSRTQATKRIWEYIKQKDLQDPSNRRRIVCDETLKGIFGVPAINMFQMPAALNRHVIGDDGNADAPAPAKRKAAPKEASSAKKAKKEGGGKRKGWPDQKLSDELQVVVGCPTAPRGEVIKKLWEYIRAHDLQNPADKRQILCDDSLRAVFGKDSVTMFSMNKLLQPHFLGNA